jgi:hypothetical protein
LQEANKKHKQNATVEEQAQAHWGSAIKEEQLQERANKGR